MGRALLYDKGLLVIDLLEFGSVVLQGILIALPLWFLYVLIKIKYRKWVEYREW